MWTKENRANYDRTKLRYPSDLSDAEWMIIEPLIPPALRGGRKRSLDIREVVNGIMYVLSTGCAWAYVPKDFPSKSTLYWYFSNWSYDGTLDKIHDTLYAACREKDERDPTPSACVIDSQSVKSAEKGGPKLTRTDMMRARRSKEKRDMRWSTRRDY